MWTSKLSGPFKNAFVALFHQRPSQCGARAGRLVVQGSAQAAVSRVERNALQRLATSRPGELEFRNSACRSFCYRADLVVGGRPTMLFSAAVGFVAVKRP